MKLLAKIEGPLMFNSDPGPKGTQLVVQHSEWQGKKFSAKVWVAEQGLEWGAGTEVVATGTIRTEQATDKDGKKVFTQAGEPVINITIFATDIKAVGAVTAWTPRQGRATTVHNAAPAGRSATQPDPRGAGNSNDFEDDLPF